MNKDKDMGYEIITTLDGYSFRSQTPRRILEIDIPIRLVKEEEIFILMPVFSKATAKKEATIPKEAIMCLPKGTELGRIYGGVDLWTRETPFGHRIYLIPKYPLNEQVELGDNKTSKSGFDCRENKYPKPQKYIIKTIDKLLIGMLTY